jgi:partitioning defective protein 3
LKSTIIIDYCKQPPEKITEDLQPVPWTEKEILVYDIPVLDTEKAGLGISVKGKTATPAQNGMIDMGIFIKSVIHGGAASRDGRVKSNDQLLSVNGVSLQNCSNTQAMETLRKTMTQDGPKPKPGFITLRIARRVPTSSAPNTDLSGCGSSASWGSKNISLSVGMSS